MCLLYGELLRIFRHIAGVVDPRKGRAVQKCRCLHHCYNIDVIVMEMVDIDDIARSSVKIKMRLISISTGKLMNCQCRLRQKTPSLIQFVCICLLYYLWVCLKSAKEKTPSNCKAIEQEMMNKLLYMVHITMIKFKLALHAIRQDSN